MVDLIDDQDVISRYKELHKLVPEEVIRNLPDTGIRKMEIFLIGNRLINIIDAEDDYDPSSLKRDKVHPKVREWEELMATMQVPLKEAPSGSRWVLMDKIYAR